MYCLMAKYKYRLDLSEPEYLRTNTGCRWRAVGGRYQLVSEPCPWTALIQKIGHILSSSNIDTNILQW